MIKRVNPKKRVSVDEKSLKVAQRQKDVEIEGELAELEAQLRIDEFELERELCGQPDLFYRAAKRLSLEISRLDAAKSHLDNIMASVELSLRRQAERRGEKLTESQFKARVQDADQVHFAREEHLRLKGGVGKFEALRDSFNQRSYALNKLVDLYISNYYAPTEDSAGSASRRYKEKAAQTAKKRMNEERRRRMGED